MTEEIAHNIRDYLKENDMKMADAARVLGVTLAAVTNQLSGKRPFGKNLAKRYADAFGFNADYLISGKGTLLPVSEHEQNDGVFIPASTLRMYENMTETIRTLSNLVDRLTR